MIELLGLRERYRDEDGAVYRPLFIANLSSLKAAVAAAIVSTAVVAVAAIVGSLSASKYSRFV